MKKELFFLEPKNDFTSEILANSVEALSTITGPEAVKGNDGVEHLTYVVSDYKLLDTIVKDKKILGLEFNLFYREGHYGPVRPWSFST